VPVDHGVELAQRLHASSLNRRFTLPQPLYVPYRTGCASDDGAPEANTTSSPRGGARRHRRGATTRILPAHPLRRCKRTSRYRCCVTRSPCNAHQLPGNPDLARRRVAQRAERAAARPTAPGWFGITPSPVRWHAQLSVEGSAGRCEAAGPDAISRPARGCGRAGRRPIAGCHRGRALLAAQRPRSPVVRPRSAPRRTRPSPPVPGRSAPPASATW
jgi:hypothetical protein